MGAHSTTQSSLGQEREGSYGVKKRLGQKVSKVSEEIRFSPIFDTSYFTARQGLFVIPCKYADSFYQSSEARLLPNLVGINKNSRLENDLEINDEDCLFMVPTGRET
jgi:hypothetical protein